MEQLPFQKCLCGITQLIGHNTWGKNKNMWVPKDVGHSLNIVPKSTQIQSAERQ